MNLSRHIRHDSTCMYACSRGWRLRLCCGSLTFEGFTWRNTLDWTSRMTADIYDTPLAGGSAGVRRLSLDPAVLHLYYGDRQVLLWRVPFYITALRHIAC